MYQSVFLPRLIYNCDLWNLTHKDISSLQDAQLNFLRRVMKVPKSTPTAALFLELGVLPVQYEIEKRQLVFLKKILDRQNHDLVKMVYNEILKYQAERNWANNVHELRSNYSLSLSDKNVCNNTIWYMEKNGEWSDQEYGISFTNWDVLYWKRTSLLSYSKSMRTLYLWNFKPEVARMVFRARVGVYDIKDNFKRKYDDDLDCLFHRQLYENFEHILQCNSGIFCGISLRGKHCLSWQLWKTHKKPKRLVNF